MAQLRLTEIIITAIIVPKDINSLYLGRKKSASNGMITHLSDRLSDSASLKDLAVSESASFGFRCELLSCQRRGFSNDISGVFSSLRVIIVTCNKIISIKAFQSM